MVLHLTIRSFPLHVLVFLSFGLFNLSMSKSPTPAERRFVYPS